MTLSIPRRTNKIQDLLLSHPTLPITDCPGRFDRSYYMVRPHPDPTVLRIDRLPHLQDENLEVE